MSDLFGAFLSDVVNDCVNGQAGPMDWSATEAATGHRAPGYRAARAEDARGPLCSRCGMRDHWLDDCPREA